MRLTTDPGREIVLLCHNRQSVEDKLHRGLCEIKQCLSSATEIQSSFWNVHDQARFRIQTGGITVARCSISNTCKST